MAELTDRTSGPRLRQRNMMDMDASRAILTSSLSYLHAEIIDMDVRYLILELWMMDTLRMTELRTNGGADRMSTDIL